jgi:hypothetical protein
VSTLAPKCPAASTATPAVGTGVSLLPLPQSSISVTAAVMSLAAVWDFAHQRTTRQNDHDSLLRRGGRMLQGIGCQGGNRSCRPIKTIYGCAPSLSPLRRWRTFNKTSAVPFCTTPHMRHPSRVVPSDQAF